jgi:hypothetical protein
MPAVHRARGFDFRMYPNDHNPPHVHAYGHGGEAKIELGGPGGARVVFARGLTKAALRRAKDEVTVHREALMAAWERVRRAAIGTPGKRSRS